MLSNTNKTYNFAKIYRFLIVEFRTQGPIKMCLDLDSILIT